MTIGEQIKAMRKKAGYTQKELAEKSGVAMVSIQQYERGVRSPRIKQLQQIANALGVPISSLLDDDIYDPLQHGFKENLYYYRNRKYRKFSRNELAEKTGIPAKRIKDYEDCNSCIFVTEDDLKILSSCFNVTPNDLKGRSITQESMIKVHSQNCILRINDAIYKLNVLGQQKAADWIEDLTTIPKYQRQPAENTTESTETALEGKDTTPDETPTETAHNPPEKD